MLGDNDLLKVKRILGKGNETKLVLEHIKQLKLGEFVFWNGEKTFLITTSKFKPKDTPKLWNGQQITNVIELFKKSEYPRNLTDVVKAWIKVSQK